MITKSKTILKIKFVLNILKTIWENRFWIGEIRIWEFDFKGKLKSMKTEEIIREEVYK